MNMTQQAFMGLCDNNSSAKTTSVSIRRISSVITTKGFLELAIGKPDNEPNVIVESFTSESATISSI